MIRFSATVTAQYPSPFSPFLPEEFEQSLIWLQQSGFDSAEVCISDYSNLSVQALKEKLDNHGLGCSTISTGQALKREDISLTHPLKENREKAVARIRQHIAAAGIVGSHVTIGLIRGRGEPGGAAKQLSLLEESLLPCIAEARKAGVTLLLEPINRKEVQFLDNALEAAKFIRKLGAEDCMGLLLDTFHSFMEEDTLAIIDTLGTAIRHVHFADSNRGFPGTGDISFDDIYRHLSRQGFAGYISFECLNLPSAEYVTAHSASFISGLKEREGH